LIAADKERGNAAKKVAYYTLARPDLFAASKLDRIDIQMLDHLEGTNHICAGDIANCVLDALLDILKACRLPKVPLSHVMSNFGHI
jgi:hypothetical protein